MGGCLLTGIWSGGVCLYANDTYGNNGYIVLVVRYFKFIGVMNGFLVTRQGSMP